MGKIIKGVKYINLVNENIFKNKSLYDNVYFTIRDIFINSVLADTAIEANSFIGCSMGDVYYDSSYEAFHYSNKLHNSCYVVNLLEWLNNLNIHNFKFDDVQIEHDGDIDMTQLMKFDDWWKQFELLKILLNEQLDKCIQWEGEDLERDYNRLCELEDEE